MTLLGLAPDAAEKGARGLSQGRSEGDALSQQLVPDLEESLWRMQGGLQTRKVSSWAEAQQVQPSPALRSPDYPSAHNRPPESGGGLEPAGKLFVARSSPEVWRRAALGPSLVGKVVGQGLWPTGRL